MICLLYNQISLYIVLKQLILYTCTVFLISLTLSIYLPLDTNLLKKKSKQLQNRNCFKSGENGNIEIIAPFCLYYFVLGVWTERAKSSPRLLKPQRNCDLEQEFSMSHDSCSANANQVKFLSCSCSCLWKLLPLNSQKLGIIN